MSITPPSNRPMDISVTEPVALAYERMKLILFQPFDLGRWFVIGFCAWLARLGESGGLGGSHSFNQRISNHHTQPLEMFRGFYNQAKDYTMTNMGWLIPVAILVGLILLGLIILFLWLSSRGKFMFLHCVALNKAEIEDPWERYSQAASSLFWFRLVFWLASAVIWFPLLLILGGLFVHMLFAQDFSAGLIFLAASLGLGVIVFFTVIGVIYKFVADFVVPIMYLRGGSCLAAGREFCGLLTDQPGAFILYILFQIVLSICLGILTIVAILLTCCMAGCLMMIPYIGTVVLLPILIFRQAYAVYFLAQFGPQYDVFPQNPPPMATGPLPGLRPV